MARNQPHSLAVGGLAALAVGIGIGRFVYTPILPGMMADLGLTGGQAGLIASANFAGYLAGALAAALPMPGSRRLVLALCLAASCLTTLAMAGLSDFWLMMAVRFVGGFASAGVLVFASGLVLERSAARGDAGAPGIYFAGVGVGIALSALLVVIVAGAGLDWRVEWLMSGLISILLAGMAVAKIDETPSGQAAGQAAKPRFSGGVLPLVLAYGLFGLGYVVTATFLVAIIRAEPALWAIEPYIWFVVGVAAAFSVNLWLKIAARQGTLIAFAAACVIEAVGVGASAAVVTQASMLLAAVLLGGTFMGITALGLVAARERVGGNPQRLMAVMTAAFGIGQIVGPSAAGYLHDRTGDFALASYGAAVALILAAVFALLARATSRMAGEV
jgi:predicted MFS family arabinose efflux permease